MATILEQEQVGVVLMDFNEDSMRKAIDRIIKLSREADIALRCRQVAVDYFSLELGVEKYSRIYNVLSNE